MCARRVAACGSPPSWWTPSSNDHIWAERYDRDLNDIFALQGEISEAIVKAMNSSSCPKRRGPSSSVARTMSRPTISTSWGASCIFPDPRATPGGPQQSLTYVRAPSKSTPVMRSLRLSWLMRR